MADAPLATLADMTARGVTVDPSEEGVVTTALATASAAVREAAGSPISRTTATVTLEGVPTSRLHLPGRPVVSVSSVAIDGVPVDDWRLVSDALWREDGWCAGRGPSEVTVTYTCGLAAVPADIVDLVCRLAGQALVAHRSGDAMARAVSEERIGDYSVTYADSETGTMTLSDFQRARLAARFGSGAGVVVKSR